MSETGSVGGGKPYADDDKIFLFLAYFGIFSLIPFFMYRDKRSDPQKEYVYWHSRQGLALAIVVFVLALILMVGGFVLAFIPFVGWALSCILWFALVIIGLGGSIMGWVKGFGGEKWEMPGISKLAQMFN